MASLTGPINPLFRTAPGCSLLARKRFALLNYAVKSVALRSPLTRCSGSEVGGSLTPQFILCNETFVNHPVVTTLVRGNPRSPAVASLSEGLPDGVGSMAHPIKNRRRTTICDERDSTADLDPSTASHRSSTPAAAKTAPLQLFRVPEASPDQLNSFLPIEHILRAAPDHLGMEIGFISEFTDGRRVFRHVESLNRKICIEVGASDPVEKATVTGSQKGSCHSLFETRPIIHLRRPFLSRNLCLWGHI